MKELQYFPFVRNRYYYGKFLSADTLDAEQKYMNNKRRFLNRFLHGNGVLFGMAVLKVDDGTIAIQPGAALDFAGREIVIDKPLLIPLKSLEKESCESEATVRYLCIEYDEYYKAAVHSEYSTENGDNRDSISENYRFYMTSSEPEQACSMAKRFYEQAEVVYMSESVMIKQTLPVMVQAGENAMLRVTVMRRIHDSDINFSYNLRLTGMKYGDDNIMQISFDSRTQAMDGDTAVLEFPLHILLHAEGETGSVETVNDSFKGGITSPPTGFSVCKMNTEIVVDRLEERLIQKFRDEGIQMILQDNIVKPPICLAKIMLENNRGVMNIERIIRMPFYQYIYSDLTDELSSFFNDNNESVREYSGESRDKSGYEMDNIGNKFSVSSGVEEIHMPLGGKTGQCFFSEPITHGLGISRVSVILGLDQPGNTTIYGDTEVFDKSEKHILNAALAAKVSETEGTFVIGLKLKEPVAKTSVKVHWTAIYSHKSDVTESAPAIQILPSLASVSVMESLTFEVRFEHMSKQQIYWKIAEGARGGVITDGGYYTAPNTPGVYQIIATASESGIQATAFVAVRDL
ncbi:MAG: hypothetical protein IJA12_06140 [Oscillospiraceae bacterium]|nr:hypothetical protein [Oscillospiraceae bacterium]